MPVTSLMLRVALLLATTVQQPSPAPAPAPPPVRKVDTVVVMLDGRDTITNPIFSELIVDERPLILSAPGLVYPPRLRLAGIGGRVLVQAIIDTSGRAEPESVKFLESPDSGFNEPVRNYVIGAQFRPARIKGRAVRVLVRLPIDFTIRRQVPP